MHAFATHWTFKPRSAEEVEEINRGTLIPALTGQPGFRQSFAIRTGEASYLTLFAWDSEAHAQAALAFIRPLVIEHQGHLVEGMERFAGPVSDARGALKMVHA